jgi:hypothetical protein
MYQKEKKDPSNNLYEKAMDSRRQELTNIKLAGAEPYVWKPLFKCESLHQKKAKNISNDECIIATFSFVDKKSLTKYTVESNPTGELPRYVYGENNEVRYLEESPPPCLICHQKQAGSSVLWTYNYKVQKPSTAITGIWESRDFIYFHAFFWSLILLYFTIKLTLILNRGNDLIAVAVKSSNEELFEKIVSNNWKAERRMFVYIEITGNNICGYIPRRYLIRLYKKYFTGEFSFSDLDLRIGVVEFNSVSFEGLRIAQAVASKAISSSVIVQDNVISAMALPDVKRAVLKRKNSELYFNVMDL